MAGLQLAAFEALRRHLPEETACYHFLLQHGSAGYGPAARMSLWFRRLRNADCPALNDVRLYAQALAEEKSCSQALIRGIDAALADPEQYMPLAYVLAWLRVSGVNSVLPPWVRLQYPAVRTLLQALRETPCTDAACQYCREHLDPRHELQRYFSFADFWSEPKDQTGGSLQESIGGHQHR